METTTIRITQVAHVPELAPPIIRTAKEWRRYQVMLRRLNERIEAQMLRANYGDPFGFNPPPRKPGEASGAHRFDATS